jgi:hypothetical protein
MRASYWPSRVNHGYRATPGGRCPDTPNGRDVQRALLVVSQIRRKTDSAALRFSSCANRRTSSWFEASNPRSCTKARMIWILTAIARSLLLSRPVNSA